MTGCVTGSASWPAAGTRVLLLARTDDDLDDAAGVAVAAEALVCLEEDIRPDAADTVRFFREQGVAVKVISGDNPLTVAAIAAEVNIRRRAPDRCPPAPRGSDALAAVLERASVFGRVQPHQKRAMVQRPPGQRPRWR